MTLNKLVLALLFTLVSIPAFAQITVPNTFSPFTVISAARFNENFTELGNKSLNRTGGTLSGNMTVGSGVTVDGADISTYLVGGELRSTTTDADSLDVAGGITAGTGNVAIVDTTGKIPALTSTYFADLTFAASNLSGTITTSALGSGTANNTKLLRGDSAWASNLLGKFGFGVLGTTPTRTLHVEGVGQQSSVTDVGSKLASMLVADTGGDTGNGGSIEFGAGIGTFPTPYFASIKAHLLDGSDNTLGELRVYTRASTNATGLNLAATFASNGDFKVASRIFENGRTTPLGEWIDVAHSAGNFTTSSGTWTVASGDQLRFSYMLVGKTMTVSFNFVNTTMSSVGNELRLAVPGSFTAPEQQSCIIAAFGTIEDSVFMGTVTGGNTLSIQRLPVTAWGSSSDGQVIRGVCSFEID